MKEGRLPSIKPQSGNSGALTAAQGKSSLSAEAVASIPVSLLHVNPLLGRQLRVTGKHVFSPWFSLPSPAMEFERVGSSPNF